jgi:hypothetical protein
VILLSYPPKYLETPGDGVLVGENQYVGARAEIDSAGHIVFKVHVLNRVRLFGFHGGAVAAFSDATGNVLFSTPLLLYGAEAKFIPGSSDRREEKSYFTSADVYLETDRIDLWVGKKPKTGAGATKLLDIAESIVAVGAPVVAAAWEIGKGLGLVNYQKINEWVFGNGSEMQHFEKTNQIAAANVARRIGR